MTNTGTKTVFYTNKDAPNFRIIVIDLKDTAEDKWTTLIKVKYKKKNALKLLSFYKSTVLKEKFVSNIGTPRRFYDLDRVCG